MLALSIYENIWDQEKKKYIYNYSLASTKQPHSGPLGK